MIICPKCKTELEANWDKTKNGKNWIKLVTGEWHSCGVEKKPELGEPITLTNNEKSKNYKESGGNLRPTSNGDLLSANWYECEKCKLDGRDPLVLKEIRATHNDLFHRSYS